MSARCTTGKGQWCSDPNCPVHGGTKTPGQGTVIVRNSGRLGSDEEIKDIDDTLEIEKFLEELRLGGASEDQLMEALERYGAGDSLDDIATDIGLDADTVSVSILEGVNRRF